MAIQIERNENGNCVNFKGATLPVYWNNCLTAVAVGTDRINIENDIRSAGAGQTYYEYFNVKIEDFCDNTGAAFTSASSAASYINGVVKATSSVGIGTTRADGEKLNWGDNNELQIFYNDNGTGIIQKSGSGAIDELQIRCNTIRLLNEATDEDFAFFRDDGAVELYYDDVKRFETTGYGASIIGGLNVTGVSTFAGDVSFGSTATFGDNDKLIFGDGSDLEIFHNGNASFIKDVGQGTLIIQGSGLRLQNHASSGTGFLLEDGIVKLYENNSEKLTTTGYGVSITGGLNVTGVSTFTSDISFGGNVSVAGTLTYEDVTNVDSIGLITARTGIEVTSGIVTAPKMHVGVGTTYSEELVVTGDARVTGILTIGTGSITLDPSAKRIEGIDEIVIGTDGTDKVTIKKDNKGKIKFEDKDGKESSVGIGTTVSINTSGIVTAAQLHGDGSNITGISTLNIVDYGVGLGGGGGITTFSGNYNDLTNRPTIPTNNNQLSNGAGYITGITGINTTGNSVFNNLNVSGISTLTNIAEIRSDDGTPGRIDFYCETSNAHYTRIQSAAHASYSGNAVVTLPTSTGTLLLTNGSGASLTGLTGASAGTYGDASNSAQITVDANGRITGISQVSISAGSNYANSDVDAHLNTSTASAGEILSWTGSDYAWVADQTGGGGGSSGIEVQNSGSSVGTGITVINFNTDLTATVNGTTATVNSTASGGGGGGVTTGKAIAMAMIFG